jgi:hypothetical protein
MSVACEACRAETSQAELNLSPAGQWLCRSCFGSYQAAAATRHARANNAVRRCTCGTIVTPLGDGPERTSEGAFFRRDVYVCSSCAKTFALPHPVTNVMLVLVGGYLLVSIWCQRPAAAAIDEVGELKGPTGASILAGLLVLWLARDFYFRWRYRRVL